MEVAAADVEDADKTEYIIVDQVNNLRRGGLDDPPGQTENGGAAGTADNPVNLISMYRKLMTNTAAKGVAPDGYKAASLDGVHAGLLCSQSKRHTRPTAFSSSVRT